MTGRSIPALGLAMAAGSLIALSGCGSGSSGSSNSMPANVTQQSVTVYSGTGAAGTAAAQDLLTAGLGMSGLTATAAPAYANPLAPTALELRRNAIYAQYKGLVDTTAAGGFGSIYGPSVDVSGNATNGTGMIPGREYIGSLDDGSGSKRVTMAVQIPDSFVTTAPCLVLGPSSGSRGVYGAVPTAGEWGLKHGCAVALVDAGKGVGLYDMMDDTVNEIDGTRATRSAAASLNFFAPSITDTARAAYNALFPNRVALKQAHSQLNPEKDWGNDTLAAAQYAIWALNDRYGGAGNNQPFNANNVLVIAGSISNGGASVLRAAEADSGGLIKGVVAGEPVIEMPDTAIYGVIFGNSAVTGFGKRLIDFTTYGNLYQPCAALATAASIGAEVSVFNYLSLAALTSNATARCTSLAAKGLVTGGTVAQQATDALNHLNNYGWSTDTNLMHSAYYGLGNGPIISAMYPMMYGRASVTDALCSTSFAQVDSTTGAVATLNATVKADSFALSNGTANGVPASVVYDNASNGPIVWTKAVSPSTGAADFGLDNALCQRSLVTGLDVTGNALGSSSLPSSTQANAVGAGIKQTLVTGNLQGKPTLILAGRNDALVPVNDGARAYVAYNKVVEQGASKVAYWEVLNAHHFDGFNSFSGFDTRFVPLHVYFVRAMDAMYARLKSGTIYAPSQVIRTTPRGGSPGAAPSLTAADVPAPLTSPAIGDQIGFSGNSITVPN